MALVERLHGGADRERASGGGAKPTAHSPRFELDNERIFCRRIWLALVSRSKSPSTK